MPRIIVIKIYLWNDVTLCACFKDHVLTTNSLSLFLSLSHSLSFSLSLYLCLSLSVSICFSLFHSVSLCFSPFLSISLCFSLFLSVSLCICFSLYLFLYVPLPLCSCFKCYVLAGNCGTNALHVLLRAQTHVRNVAYLSALRAAYVHVLAPFSTTANA